jgi:hypothetical protein
MGGVTGVFTAGAALGLTGPPPGLMSASARGVGAGLGVTGLFMAGAALGLAARACASLLQISKSACVGPAASAMLAKASRLTPEMTSISSVNLRMIRVAFFSDRVPPCYARDEGHL